MQRVQLPSRRAKSRKFSSGCSTTSRKQSLSRSRALTSKYDEYLVTVCRDFSALSKMRFVDDSRKICRLSTASRTRKPETNARAIMSRNRRAIYYAPFDHHLNANSLITPGANCYVLARLFALAYEQISEAFSRPRPSLLSLYFTILRRYQERIRRREKD